MAKWRRRAPEGVEVSKLALARTIAGYRIRLGAAGAEECFLKLRPEYAEADYYERINLIHSLTETELRELARATGESGLGSQILHALHGKPRSTSNRAG